jgi:SAM-dependent methyltransferase
MKAMTNHNRTCNLADFRDPTIRELIRAIFAHEIPLFPAEYPDGVADSKQWEIAMGIRALREFGALRPDARMLGIGAGTEATTFYLSRHVRQVVATDIYAGAGPWADVAPSGFLADPTAFAAGIACDPRRILPLHQDARALDLPDEEFDGVYSSGSIEHFGSLAAVANAAHEIGRVLRPGGIATIATEFKVAGPPDGNGWDPSVILFSPAKLQRYIVEASGLEPVDELRTELDEETLSVRRDLLGFLNAAKKVTHPAQKTSARPFRLASGRRRRRWHGTCRAASWISSVRPARPSSSTAGTCPDVSPEPRPRSRRCAAPQAGASPGRSGGRCDWLIGSGTAQRPHNGAQRSGDAPRLTGMHPGEYGL